MSRVRPATVADLLAIPEGERFHELIDGALVEKDAASGKHGEAQLSLGILLRPFRRGGAGGGPGGWIRHAPEGYLEALVAVRGETVRAEPFEARELAVGVLFGDDEPP